MLVSKHAQEKLVSKRLALIKNVGRDAWLDMMYRVKLDQRSVLKLVKYSVPLHDVVNPEELVNRHVLRMEGIEPGAARIVLGGNHSFSYAPLNLIVLREDTIIPSYETTTSEQDVFLYMTLAHELTHLKQQLSGDLSNEQSRKYQQELKFHSDRPDEQEAFFWESQQAAKMGLGREDYDAYNKWLYPLRHFISRDDKEYYITERVRREGGALPVLSRRPVQVRGHPRRHS